jgi:hypothetical protein
MRQTVDHLPDVIIGQCGLLNVKQARFSADH